MNSLSCKFSVFSVKRSHSRRNHLLQRSKAPPIRKCIMYRGDGLKILHLDFTIFCCSIIYSVILIIFCSVNHLKSGKVYWGVLFCLLKFSKWLPRSNASELRVNSADFEVGENDQVISQEQRPFVLRA